MHRRILGVDIDGTIWSCYEIAAEEINRLSGRSISLADMVEYDSFHEIAGREIADAGFAKACAVPDSVMERVLYPGVVEAIEELHTLSVRVHFVTHNANPEQMRTALARWLRGVLEVPFGLSVTTTGGKLPILKRVGAFGLIDDKPSTLESAADVGLWAATKIQPWNLEVVERRPDVHGFEHWSEVPALLEPALV